MDFSLGKLTSGRIRNQAQAGQGANLRLRWSSTLRLARRELLAALQGPSLYLMTTLACLVAAVLMKSYLDYISNNGTLVMADSLRAPLLFAILITTGYLGLVAAAGLGGERERGTLEVLFYGPVDTPTYIAGKLLGHLATYVPAMAVLAGFLGLASWLTGLPFGVATLLLLTASVLPAAGMIALGLFLAALVGRIRPALALTMLTIALFVAIDVGTGVAAAQPSDSLLGSAAGLLSALADLTSWLSPFSYLWRAADSFALGSTSDTLIALGEALVYGVVLTCLAAATLHRRGVHRWRE